MIGRLLDRLAWGGLLLSGGTLLLNLARFRVPPPVSGPRAERVSILVPARNEARSIEACVRSLLAQEGVEIELLVLDDRSTDATGAILARIAAELPAAPFRLLAGAPLPPGWSGKNWACHQLAEQAAPESDYLLFTDADTRHAPDALARALGEAARGAVGLLSLMPRQRVGTTVERATIPLLALQILGYLPLLAMERLSDATWAAANGQVLLFNRATYEAAGGHYGCRARLSEDVALARAVKRTGGRIRLGNGVGLVDCRMYEGGQEIVAGFRRSFGGGFDLDPRVSLIPPIFNLLVYFVPLLRAPWSAAARRQGGLILLLRLTMTRWLGDGVAGVLLHPLGMATLLLAQGLAAWDTTRGGEREWKGRRYDGGMAGELSMWRGSRYN